MGETMTVDKSTARVRDMFASIAPRYDLMNHILSLGIDLWWRRRTVKLVPAEPDGGPILDVCTGTGDLALAYWRKNQSGITIVGADYCRPMLSIAREKCLREHTGEAITLVEADAQYLPFVDNTFQIVCVAFGLRNVSDTDRGLQEMTRVCKPGGRVAVLEFSSPTIWPLGQLYRWYFFKVLPRVGQALARNDKSAYNYLPESVSQFPHGEALAERMRAVGLERVAYTPFTLGISTLYVGHKAPG